MGRERENRIKTSIGFIVKIRHLSNDRYFDVVFRMRGNTL